MKKHLTGREVAERLGVEPATIRAWRSRGGGPPFSQPAGKGTQATYDPDVVEMFAAMKNRRKSNGRHPASE
jgi:DNA-binding transcriptional MerR regulator